jgi:hypothetical protein
MNKETGDKWYIHLKELIKLEYDITEDEAETIISIGSEYGLSSTKEFFIIVEEEVGLISVWNKTKWKEGINSKLLEEHIQKQLED